MRGHETVVIISDEWCIHWSLCVRVRMLYYYYMIKHVYSHWNLNGRSASSSSVYIYIYIIYFALINWVLTSKQCGAVAWCCRTQTMTQRQHTNFCTVDFEFKKGKKFTNNNCIVIYIYNIVLLKIFIQHKIELEIQHCSTLENLHTYKHNVMKT